MLSFQQAVVQVHNFCEGDSEIDILMRLIDNLRDNVEKVQKKEDGVGKVLERVCAFIEKVDMTMGGTVDPLNPMN
jgi:hypothetical protein